MSNIPLSPKYGVNPCMRVCFWCGEIDGLALMGRIRKKDPYTGRAVRGSDEEAPRQAVLDYEPCPKCAEHMSLGVTCMEATTVQPSDNRPEIQKGIYPTGRFCVIKEEAANNVFPGYDLKTGGKIFIEDVVFEQVFGEALKK